MNKAVAELASQLIVGNDEVVIVIDSPGGDMQAGTKFVSAMQALSKFGVSTTCIVNGMAVSMAFDIFLHCDKRLALPEAQLMFHQPSLFFDCMGYIKFTASEMERFAVGLRSAYHFILNRITRRLPLDPQTLMQSFIDEYFWTAPELRDATYAHFLTIIEDDNNEYNVKQRRQPKARAETYRFQRGKVPSLIYLRDYAARPACNR